MDNIRDRLKEENITGRCRKTRLRWFGHVQRRDQEIVGDQQRRWYRMGEDDEVEEDQSRDEWNVSTET